MTERKKGGNCLAKALLDAFDYLCVEVTEKNKQEVLKMRERQVEGVRPKTHQEAASEDLSFIIKVAQRFGCEVIPAELATAKQIFEATEESQRVLARIVDLTPSGDSVQRTIHIRDVHRSKTNRDFGYGPIGANDDSYDLRYVKEGMNIRKELDGFNAILVRRK